jgi:hypothetical protein
MFHYSGFALSIASELELPGLEPATGPHDVMIRLGKVEQRVRRRATKDEEHSFSSGVGHFLVRDGQTIIVDPAAGGDPASLRSMLLGRVMGYLMRQRGCLPLHGSAVRVEGKAILFLGDSGMGKSTTVAAFYAAGHVALADELCALGIANGGCELRVSGSPIRLTPDSFAAFGALPAPIGVMGKKFAIGLTGKSPESISVGRIYILDYGEHLHTHAILPLKAVQTLSINSFMNRRGMDPEASAAHLRLCTSVATSVPIFRLVRQRSLALIEGMVRLVERLSGAE